MERDALGLAADTIVDLQNRRIRLDCLPPECRPATLAQAHAIQEAAIVKLGEPVAGWKMSVMPDGAVMRGALLPRRVWTSPAHVPASSVPLLGVEAEIAFRLKTGLPPRDAEYDRDEIEQALVALAAIEIVDSRFRSYTDAPPLDRTADFMSNGGFVTGQERPDWRNLDLVTLPVELLVDGKSLVSRTGGHVAGHPVLPAIALINELRKTTGMRAGQILTTGTYTGLNFVQPGQTVTAVFAGFGTVEVTFDA
jgi:2-keto-4-pentenoate hydratase